MRHAWVDRRLVLTFIYMRAVVVGFDAALGIGGVDVEGIEVGTDLFEWCKVLVMTTLC